MTDKELFKAIEKIIDSNTVNNLKKFVIIKESNGYRVFEKYLITKTFNGFEVSQLNSDTKHTFMTVKNALTWCTLYDRNKILEAQRVKFLDSIITGLNMSNLLLESYLKKTKERDKKFIYLNKIVENKLKYNSLQTEISVLSNTAKKYQLGWLSQTSYK